MRSEDSWLDDARVRQQRQQHTPLTATAKALTDAAVALRDDVTSLMPRFKPPVAFVYNPLDYAWSAHARYIEKFGSTTKQLVLVGMNPGPWGMAQTGVPFGEVGHVTRWMGIDASVASIGRPQREHPKRPVLGFACARSEVSGARLWGAIAAKHPRAETFFQRAFVINFCPLLFLDEGGRNITPDKLPATQSERLALEAVCRAHLGRALAALQPECVLGVGAYAAKQVASVVDDPTIRRGVLPHPSPASPQANRGWARMARSALQKMRILDVL